MHDLLVWKAEHPSVQFLPTVMMFFSGQSFKRGREELEAAKGCAVLRALLQGLVYISLLEACNLHGYINKDQASSLS